MSADFNDAKLCINLQRSLRTRRLNDSGVCEVSDFCTLKDKGVPCSEGV